MKRVSLRSKVSLIVQRIRNSHRLFTLPLLLIFCTLFYYFGELADWAVWETLRKEFFYGVHDIHRLLFLAPIIYAGYVGRVKSAIIVTLVTFLIFLPRAFFISPFPDPLLRMVFFTIIAGVIGCLTGVIRNKSERCTQLEASLINERNKLIKIVDGVADGIIITDSSYKIRFMNSKMVNEFGEGTGSYCHKLLHNLDEPCEGCKTKDVILQRKIKKWHCEISDGRTYEIVAAPYADDDSSVCQLSVFRNMRHIKKL